MEQGTVDRRPPDGSVLIVGAGPGLGRALAKRFARGGNPVAMSTRDAGAVSRLAEELSGSSGRVIAVPGDATKIEDVERVVATVQDKLGPIGTLIYNAGNYVLGRLGEISPETFERALAVGVYGAFLYSRAVHKAMAARGEGAMLFTGATTSVMAPAQGPAFAAAKFGLRGFALALARDLRRDGIHVAHVIVDGVIDTPRTRERSEWPDDEMLDPREIAEAYWLLASQSPRAWSFEMDLRTSKDDYLDN